MGLEETWLAAHGRRRYLPESDPAALELGQICNDDLGIVVHPGKSAGAHHRDDCQVVGSLCKVMRVGETFTSWARKEVAVSRRWRPRFGGRFGPQLGQLFGGLGNLGAVYLVQFGRRQWVYERKSPPASPNEPV